MFERGFGLVLVQVLRLDPEKLFDFLESGRYGGEDGGRLGGDVAEKLTVRKRVERDIEKQQREPEPAMRFGLRRELEHAGKVGQRTIFQLRGVARKQTREIFSWEAGLGQRRWRDARQTQIAEGTCQCSRESRHARDVFEICEGMGFALRMNRTRGQRFDAQ